MRLTPFGEQEQGLFYVKNSLHSLHALPDITDRLGKGESGTLSPTFIMGAGYNIIPKLISHFRQPFHID